MLQITYSYWDGSGHRKVIQVRKGTTVGRYLELVKQQVKLLSQLLDNYNSIYLFITTISLYHYIEYLRIRFQWFKIFLLISL